MEQDRVVLNFDENDGFFDHVPPPAAPSYTRWNADPKQAELAGASTVDTTGEYHEVVVPYHDTPEERALLHRPYRPGAARADAGDLALEPRRLVNSQVFDHGSVLRFIEKRFGIVESNISPWRRAVCGDLSSAFNFADPDNTDFFNQLPETLQRANRAKLHVDHTTPPPPPRRWRCPRRPKACGLHARCPTRWKPRARVDNGQTLTLKFTNSGAAGAVVSRLQPARPERAAAPLHGGGRAAAGRILAAGRRRQVRPLGAGAEWLPSSRDGCGDAGRAPGAA